MALELEETAPPSAPFLVRRLGPIDQKINTLNAVKAIDGGELQVAQLDIFRERLNIEDRISAGDDPDKTKAEFVDLMQRGKASFGIHFDELSERYSKSLLVATQHP